MFQCVDEFIHKAIQLTLKIFCALFVSDLFISEKRMPYGRPSGKSYLGNWKYLPLPCNMFLPPHGKQVRLTDYDICLLFLLKELSRFMTLSQKIGCYLCWKREFLTVCTSSAQSSFVQASVLCFFFFLSMKDKEKLSLSASDEI